VWTPGKDTHLRAACTHSLGAVFLDNSFRLEPTQVARFQAFRSLAPESAVGLFLGTRFETAGLGLDHKFKSNAWGVLAQLPNSSRIFFNSGGMAVKGSSALSYSRAT
jgi:hypothetical protein